MSSVSWCHTYPHGVLSGLATLLTGWRRPRWRTPEYRLFDASVAVFVTSGILYMWTRASSLGASATAAPSGVLEMFSGLAYGEAQAILGSALMVVALVTAALSFRPGDTPYGYRVLFAVSAWWCFQLVWGLIIFDLPARNLISALPYGMVASWLYQTMPNVVDYQERTEADL